jgi:transposase
MTSLTDLRDVVDVVIGVDTHVQTHSAAVLDTATGGVLDEITVERRARCRTWAAR